jgi:hypothetical protein
MTGLEIGNWNLGFGIWDLEFGNWNLEFGISFRSSLALLIRSRLTLTNEPIHEIAQAPLKEIPNSNFQIPISNF